MNKHILSLLRIIVSFVIVFANFIPTQVQSTIAPPSGTASLALTTLSDNILPGATFSVTITLNTNGEPVDGVDIKMLRFDPAKLSVVDAMPGTVGTQISPGTLMPFTLVNRVDNTAGTIEFSQVTAGGAAYTGSGTLASFTFTALTLGTALVYFDNSPGSTTDTNVASDGLDILSISSGGTYIIAVAPSGGAGGGSSGGSSSKPKPGPTPLPPIGLIDGDNFLCTGDGTVYYYFAGKKEAYPDLFSYQLWNGNDFSKVKTITSAECNNIIYKGLVRLPERTLVRVLTDPTIYRLESTTARPFTSYKVFMRDAEGEQVYTVTIPYLHTYSRGADIR